MAIFIFWFSILMYLIGMLVLAFGNREASASLRDFAIFILLIGMFLKFLGSLAPVDDSGTTKKDEK